MVGEFQIYHSYKKLADEGKVKHLTCPSCDTGYVSQLGDNDQLTLACFTCGSRITLGARAWETIRAVVKEHVLFDEDSDKD